MHLIRKAEFYGMLQKTLAKLDRASMANSLEVRVPFSKKGSCWKNSKNRHFNTFSDEKKKKNPI